MAKPLCFVLMPFGKKPGAGGAVIDFDAVYHDLIKPAVEAADLMPLRADEEQAGGIIHKPMFERLILCDYAVADLTTANANVFYELGVRHAVKPATTVLLFAADGTRLPFDLAPLRTLRYQLGPDGRPADAAGEGESLKKLLAAVKKGDVDSPVYQLVEGFPDIQHIKTDVFREQVEYSARIKDQLAAARRLKGDARIAAIRAIEQGLGPLDRAEAGVLVDLLLSYRAATAWKEMARLAGAMPEPLRRSTLVQEQLAFALNRDGDGEKAEQVLLDLIGTRGPSSETYGLLGRVYKDRWDAATKQGEKFLARGLLDKAIEAYRKGFESRLARLLSGHQRGDADDAAHAAGPAPRCAAADRALRGRAQDRVGQAGLLGPRHDARARRARGGREQRVRRTRPGGGGDPRALGARNDGAQPAPHS